MERKQNFPKAEKTETYMSDKSKKQQSDIRNRHKALRNAMSPEEIKEKSNMICRKLQHTDWYTDCDIIYAYYPLGNEVNCLPFLEQAFRDGKRVALPKTLPECRMEFYEVTSLSQVAEGGFHVMEPIESCSLLQKEDIVVLVPGVVFDKCGNRYGYGKGYYDRYFVRYPKLRRIALAYENQVEAQLEVQKTDAPMEWIYTEGCIYSGKIS